MLLNRDWASNQSLDRATRLPSGTWWCPSGPSVWAPHRRQTAIRPLVSGRWWASSRWPTVEASRESMISPCSETHFGQKPSRTRARIWAHHPALTLLRNGLRRERRIGAWATPRSTVPSGQAVRADRPTPANRGTSILGVDGSGWATPDSRARGRRDGTQVGLPYASAVPEVCVVEGKEGGMDPVPA